MTYNLIFSDTKISYLIAKYRTLQEAEKARNNIAYNTNEFQFEKLKIFSAEEDEEVVYKKK